MDEWEQMATERRLASRAGPEEPQTQHQALVASLHAAIEALTVCVESIHGLLEQAAALAQAEQPPAHHRRARISYGGGVSPLASVDHRDYPDDDPSAAGPASIADAEAVPQRHHGIDARPGDAGTPRPGVPALMAATDLAHRGYSRDEIAERLRERWGDEASQILRDLID